MSMKRDTRGRFFRVVLNDTEEPSPCVPVKFMHNRTVCLYKGGKLIDEFFGQSEILDENRPEEWIGSVVRNTTRFENELEGLSFILKGNEKVLFKDYLNSNPEKILGQKHFEKFKSNPAILVKFIDSAVRLLIQVHPDNAYAKKHLNSQFGKTEAWYILDTNKDIKDPYLLLGFKPETTKEKWRKAFENQNVEELLNFLHKIPARKGDVFIIEGGMPHAIGPGCFILEIQEPTDFTMRVERTTPWGSKVSEKLMHQGTGFQNMLECFDYTTYTQEELIQKVQRFPKIIAESIGGRETALLDSELDKDRKYFFLTKMEIFEKFITENSDGFFIAVVTKGYGTAMAGCEKLIDFSKGYEIFFPANSGDITWENAGKENLEVIRCFPPD